MKKLILLERGEDGRFSQKEKRPGFLKRNGEGEILLERREENRGFLRK
jgi:hypothetical protein